MIPLPQGSAFDEQLLIRHIRSSGRDYIIEGKQADSFENHRKPHSLDYWLRENFAINRDTKQAENAVRDALVATGLFAFATGLRCPDTGRPCNGLRLV